MESREQREPQGTPEDNEQGSPQDRLLSEGLGGEDGSAADAGAHEDGGADSPADAASEGG